MRCPICGSKEYKEVLKGKEIDYCVCEGCSVRFDDPDKFLVEEEEEEEEEEEDNKPSYRPNPFSGRVLYGIGLPNNLY